MTDPPRLVDDFETTEERSIDTVLDGVTDCVSVGELTDALCNGAEVTLTLRRLTRLKVSGERETRTFEAEVTGALVDGRSTTVVGNDGAVPALLVIEVPR